MLRFRYKNLAATGVTTRLRHLADHAADSLAAADYETLLDLLALEVHVIGWEKVHDLSRQWASSLGGTAPNQAP